MSRKSVRAGRSPYLAIAAGFAIAAPALAGPTIAIDQTGTENRLSLVGGPVFHSTAAPVLNPRVVALPAGGSVALWEERGKDGLAHPWYALSADGAAFSRARQTDNRVNLKFAAFDPAARQPGVPARLAAAPESSAVLVQFIAPPTEDMRDAVRALGGVIHQYVPDHTYIVTLPAPARAEVAALPFVRWVGPFHPAYKLEQSILPRAVAGGAPDSPARYGIMVLERGPAPQEAVAARVRELGGQVNLLLPQGFRMEATLSLGAVVKIAAMDQVLFIDPWAPPGTDMNIAREISGANAVETALAFNGQGVRAEVLDSGLRLTHLAYQNPAPILHNGNSTDSSHGSCVYGIVFGNGAVVANGRGVLPGRQQGIFSSFYNLTDRHLHTAELVNPSGQYRAILQSNSWGSGLTLTYTTISAQMDDIVFDHDILITQSQSNTGNQQSRPEAWAKNVLSIGGVDHKDTLPRTDDEWTGASIGPSQDGRIKPELTHFYDKILCPSDLTNTSYTPDFGGTSGATPITAGHAGLVFQMWHEGVFSGFGGGASVFASRPHFSTVKAMLINTAFQYPFTSGQDNLSRDKQGWGMADLDQMLQNSAKTFIVNETDVLTQGNKKTYALLVEQNEPQLKITLAYSDPMGNPAAAIDRINDLSLKVTSPAGAVYWGNNGLKNGLWSTEGGVSNTLDTVENVFILAPDPGFWLVEVIADQIVLDGHIQTPGVDADFALVAHPVQFTQPVVITLPVGTPTLIPPGIVTDIDVEITQGSQNAVPSTAATRYRFGTSGPFLTSPMQHLGGPFYRAVIPAATCGQTVQFYFSCQGDGGGTALDPVTAPQAFYSAAVGTTSLLVYDDFEGDTGWAVTNTLPVQDGPWERGVPAGGGGQGDPPTDFDNSGQCFTTGLAANSDVDGGPTVLTSPTYALGAYPNARISFARWAYTNDEDTSDNLQVHVSNNNGGTWVAVESVGADDPQWFVKSFQVSTFVQPTNQTRLRFTISDNPLNSLTEGGVDALQITAVVCSNPCYADCNQDTTLTVADFGCFQTRFVAGDPYADCNADTTLSVADFGCFQTKFVQGCP